MNVLETTSVFVILIAAAILLVKRGPRTLEPFRDGISPVFWERKPIPEENEESNFNQVYNPAKKKIRECFCVCFFF